MRELYAGAARQWYMQRLKHMYKTKPRCPLLFSLNHLTGTCPTCGAGRYATSTRLKLQTFACDRIYTMLGSENDVQHIPFALTLSRTLYTNAEFPLPVISYQTFTHIPMFLDVERSIVIDFLPDTKRTSRVVMATNRVLEPCGYNYVVYDGEREIFKSDELKKQEQNTAQAFRLIRQVNQSMDAQNALRQS